MKYKIKLVILLFLFVTGLIIMIIGCVPKDQLGPIDDGAIPPGLVLWNKLGSPAEVQNSEVGVNGTIAGAVTFNSAKFGNGFLSDADGEYINFDLSAGTEISCHRGTLEFWIKAGFNLVDGDKGGNSCVQFCFNDDSDPFFIYYFNHFTLLSRFSILNQGANYLAVDGTTDWNIGDLVHLAFVWDKDGFNGGKKSAIYVNGSLVVSNNTNVTIITVNTNLYNLMLGNHNVLGYTYPSDNVIDNVKLWNYAKTDFSDRFKEGF